MAIAKRIFLFLAVNLLVVLTISITMSLLGVRPYLEGNGINYESLLIFCGLFGFGGAFISLAISKWMAKWSMGVQIINPANAGGRERALLQLVHRLAQKAGITKMPEVGIYPSAEVNAFATGPSKNNSLVAVSAGLLNSMDDAAVEGVLAHEVAHVANGDMVTMTLIQGIVNTFVMFFARIAGWAVANAMAGDRDDRAPSYLVMNITVFVFEIFFSLLGSIVVCWFSRWREFRADAGGARFASKQKMVHALQSLQSHFSVDESKPAIASLKINGKPSGMMALFSTHPPLELRIARLQQSGAGAL